MILVFLVERCGDAVDIAMHNFHKLGFFHWWHIERVDKNGFEGVHQLDEIFPVKAVAENQQAMVTKCWWHPY